MRLAPMPLNPRCRSRGYEEIAAGREAAAEQRDEGLAAGVGQVGTPTLAAGAEHAVLVDPDDGPDRGALGAFQAGKSPVEIGWAEALLSEQGPGLRTVGCVEPIARSLEQGLHVGAPRSGGRRRRADDPVDGGAALGADPVGTDLAGAGGLDVEAELLLERAGDGAADGVVLPAGGLGDLLDRGALGALEHLDHLGLLGAGARRGLRGRRD